MGELIRVERIDKPMGVHYAVQYTHLFQLCRRGAIDTNKWHMTEKPVTCKRCLRLEELK